jgi:hypothetical protein
LTAGLLAVPFGAAMILADTWILFPKDTNLLLPDSLAFYPAIGFLVEVLFHLLPLGLVLLLVHLIGGDASQSGLVWWILVLLALLEPAYQIYFLTRSGVYQTLELVFIGTHIALFNLVQLTLFKRYDFLSMYSFRLSYYLLWHILWGQLRLGILF